MTGRNIVIVIVIIVIVALIAYFMTRSGYYDGVLFNYAPANGLMYYENGALPSCCPQQPCCDRFPAVGMDRCEGDRRASLAEAIALRNAANVQELKRKAAECREMAAKRDMNREAALKLAAEYESRSLRNMADIHERLSRDEADSAAKAMAIADSASARMADIKQARQMALMERAGCPMNMSMPNGQQQQQMMMKTPLLGKSY